MQTISPNPHTLQAEQLEDMARACAVLARQGDLEDSEQIAAALLCRSAIHGFTGLVQRAAAGALAAVVASAIAVVLFGLIPGPAIIMLTTGFVCSPMLVAV